MDSEEIIESMSIVTGNPAVEFYGSERW